jgi:hypothetical protein
MPIITADGVQLKGIEQITIDNTAEWTAKTGEVNVDPSSASGELIAIKSEIEERNNQDVADAYTNTTIQASGDFLDDIGTVKNIERRTNIPTIVYCYITGVDATVIPVNTELICSSNDESFFTQYQVTISGGIAYVAASSENIGVSCPAETIDFATSISGATITNNKAGILGFVSESDEDYRARIQGVGSSDTVNLKDGMHFALLDIDGVSKVNILDNNTDATIEGVPARYFAPVVLGGDTAEVAQTIYNFMGAGNPSYGDISQGVTSRRGQQYSVSFYRPTQLLVTIAVTITVDSTFDTTNGIGSIESILADYVNGLNIGETLYIQKLESLCFIQGVTSATALLNGSSNNVSTAFNEELYANATNTTVTT